MDKKDYFLYIFKLAEKRYKHNGYRLAADGWKETWQTLIATIMSAQSRDETTIPIAENLFRSYRTLDALAKANYGEVLSIFKSLNYNKTKAKHVILAAQYIIQEYRGTIPQDIEQLLAIPGVGRKTANLIMSECHNLPGICVDTHVHRISNVLGLVKTKTPAETEFALREIAPRRYWGKINRYFVLWGKEVPGYERDRLIAHLTAKR